ncbi:MAG: hypothetical protein ACW99U_16720 [Candidatus Thorarchaeota archaeon]|jgi:hypothetical protein
MRSVRKVIVLGQNSALLAGYLRRASMNCVSFQLYSTLGVGIGVSRVELDDNREIAIQLWSLPNEQRRFDFTKSFAKGHSGAIVVLGENDVEHVAELLAPLTDATQEEVMFVVVGSIRCAERLARDLQTNHGKRIEITPLPDVPSSMPILVRAMYADRSENLGLPVIVSIPEEQCREFHPQPGSAVTEPPTRDEMRQIKILVQEWNVEVVQDVAIVSLPEGKTSTSLESGEVRFRPSRCDVCERSCLRETKLCILGTDKGWSDGTFGAAALLIIAKVNGLVSNDLPDHVRGQIHRASHCNDFSLDVKCFDEHAFADLVPSYPNRQGKKPLLDEARRRLEDGRLSRSAFEMLEKWLVRNEE